MEEELLPIMQKPYSKFKLEYNAKAEAKSFKENKANYFWNKVMKHTKSCIERNGNEEVSHFKSRNI